MMKQIFLICSFIAFINLGFGQNSIYGVYKTYHYPKITILPDSDSIIWQETNIPSFNCHYEILKDTLLIFFGENSIRNDTIQRYLISRYNLLENPEIEGIILNRIYVSDTIISEQAIGKLSDYVGTYLPSWVRVKAYHNNGNKHYEIKILGKLKTCSFYHSNGSLSQVQFYEKTWRLKYYKRRYKSHGTWYYYNEQGQVEKIEIYKRGKLKKQIIIK